MDPFAMQFGMSFGLPFTFNANWGQQASWDPSGASQPQQQNAGGNWGNRPFGLPARPPRPISQPDRSRQQSHGDGGDHSTSGPPASWSFSQTNQSYQQGNGGHHGQRFNQPAPASRFHTNSAGSQNNRRRQGDGDRYRPAQSQPNQQSHRNPTESWDDQAYRPPSRERRQRRRGAAGRGDAQGNNQVNGQGNDQGNGRRRRRAEAPVWHFPDGESLPSPRGNPAGGPFGATSPLRHNNAAAPQSTRPPFDNQRTQIPGLDEIPGLGAPGASKKKNKGIKRKLRSRSRAGNNNNNPGGGALPPANPPLANATTPRSFDPAQPDNTDNPPPGTADRDAITAPSAASGGIPNPTPTYLARASQPIQLLPYPKPLLVVIDLNGTLLYRPNKRNPSHFVERPHARSFLQRCLAQHIVVIWSSARPENVQRMCAQLLAPEDLSRVVSVWGRNRFGLSADDYNRRTQCYKRLTRLWEDPVVAASHPQAGHGGVWDQGNTVLIDDSAEKARSEPHNAVTLPEFAGNLREQPQVLPLVEDYLEALSWQMDVSTYVRVNSFTM